MRKIPMSSPELTEDDKHAVQEVLETRYLSMGPKIEGFEDAVAKFVGAKYAVGVNSGTSGLHLAVKAAGIKEGDLVITTPFSFIASANCILFEKAIPVFVDIDPLTLNIDPKLVEQAAGDLKHGGDVAEKWLPVSVSPDEIRSENLKALLPVDAFGQPADYEQLNQVAEEHELIVIEDSCEALGAEYNKRKAGMLGDIGVFAFYPNKQMTTGEGGMIVTDRKEWDRLFRSLRNQGRDVFDAWLNHTRLGYNYRLDEMSAALGLSQMQRIERLLEKRAMVAGWYEERLQEIQGLKTPHVASTTTRMSWFVYVVRLDPKLDRRCIMEELRERGIPSRPYFTPIHLQPFYVEKFGYKRGDFPITEEAGDTCLALPFSSVMKEDQVAYVCRSLREIL